MGVNKIRIFFSEINLFLWARCKTLKAKTIDIIDMKPSNLDDVTPTQNKKHKAKRLSTDKHLLWLTLNKLCKMLCNSYILQNTCYYTNLTSAS